MKPLPFSTESEILGFGRKVNTPFYLYDEKTVENQCQMMKDAFSWATGFKNYFAVKATPIPQILKLIKAQGFGVDCSSYAELMLAETVGFHQESIFFTSNNTTTREYKKAFELGAIINLDDSSHLNLLQTNSILPEHICFRYNPGCLRAGNSILGNPTESKFGMTKEQLFNAYEKARSLGCKTFSLHTMILSNCLEPSEFLKTAEMMFDLVKEIKDRLGIFISQVNLGGGYGIPYKPHETPLDTFSLGKSIKSLYEDMLNKGFVEPFKISLECGRFITGPAGILVSRVINKKSTYKNYLGVDASIANLLRPAMYGAYHHITHLKEREVEDTSNNRSDYASDSISVCNIGTYDVVGSLCENNDKLATDRYIGPGVSIGDILVFHDTGAHCSAMGFHYNGKLQCAEYLQSNFGEIFLIKRSEKHEDLFSTLVW